MIMVSSLMTSNLTSSGLVPQEIKIDEFPRCDYFLDSILHNNYVWCDLTNFELIKEEPVNSLIFPEDKGKDPTLETFRIFRLKQKKTGKLMNLVAPQLDVSTQLYSALGFNDGDFPTLTTELSPLDTIFWLEKYYEIQRTLPRVQTQFGYGRF